MKDANMTPEGKTIQNMADEGKGCPSATMTDGGNRMEAA